jgi:predicted CoA-substrate-specific enzyme activase
MGDASAGLDVGALWTKAVIVRDGRPVSSCVVPTADQAKDAAERALDEALAAAGTGRAALGGVVATGAGRKRAACAKEQATEVMCLARGASFLRPGTRVVLDLGAEGTRAARLDERGEVLEYALNDKCAAGTGVFLDAIAGVLGVPIEELGPLSLTSTADVQITSMCVAFAESEVVSMVHRRTPKQDILRGLHRAIASRIFGLVNRLGVEDGTLAAGGLARNTGLVACLEELMKRKVERPEEPRMVNALGAALLAAGGEVRR